MIAQVNYIDALLTIFKVNNNDILRNRAANEIFDQFNNTLKREGLKMSLIHSTVNINGKNFENGVIEKIVISDSNNKEYSVPCTEENLCEIYKKMVISEYKYRFEKMTSDDINDYNKIINMNDSLTSCTKLGLFMNAVAALAYNDDDELCYKIFVAIKKKYNQVLNNRDIRVDIAIDPENGLNISIIGYGFHYNYDNNLLNVAYAFYNLVKMFESSDNLKESSYEFEKSNMDIECSKE